MAKILMVMAVTSIFMMGMLPVSTKPPSCPKFGVRFIGPPVVLMVRGSLTARGSR